MYTVHVYRTNGTVEKVYNATDLNDAKRLYNHWINEADNGQSIVIKSDNRIINKKIKDKNGRMTVLKE